MNDTLNLSYLIILLILNYILSNIHLTFYRQHFIVLDEVLLVSELLLNLMSFIILTLFVKLINQCQLHV